MLTASGKSFLDFKKESNIHSFPKDFSDYIKSFGDTYFWEKGNFHVVTKASDARIVLTSSEFSADRGGFFISRMPEMDLSLIQDFFGIVSKMMVMSDDENHNNRRKIAARGFEDHIIDRFAKTVESTVKKIVANVKNKESFEFVEELSKELPSTVLADLFGLPEADRADFFQAANIMTGFFGGATSYLNADGIRVNNAAKSLKTYFQNLIVERREGDGHDYVSILLRAQTHTGMSDDELISQLIMMFVAGQVTTTDQINNIMFLLATNPKLQIEIKNDPSLLSNALEELKRIDPAVTFIFRVARAHTKIGVHTIVPGDVIFISNHAVNRDLPEASKPDEINIRREVSHFAYGHGSHYCLGAKLGRLEIKLLFEEILRELPVLILDKSRESKRDHYSLSFSGFESLYLKK